MTSRFENVAIIGVGLLGGSLGLAIKAHDLASAVIGVGHRQASIDKAIAVGAVDLATMDLDAAVAAADLIVVCTPAASVAATLDAVRAACKTSAVVTDVASTKAAICRHAQDTWPAPRRFVGSHPMAGSEKYGPEHATANLYAGCIAIVEKDERLDPQAREDVIALWRAVGANVVEVEPCFHDDIVARTSHVPHVAAAALAILAAHKQGIGAFVGKGFRDATRIAASRPEIWRDICLTNGSAIEGALDDLIARLQEFRDAVSAGDGPAMDNFFRRGNEARREALEE
jgi:prephenate dehydrogenase